MKPLLLIAALALPLHAGPRTSTDYSLAPEAIASGGGRVSSTNYTIDSSLGSPGGGTTVADNLLAKSGYAGQLYDMAGLAIAADPATIDEAGTRQLTAQAALDDGTSLALAAGDVAWSMLTGPLTGVNAAGVATASPVYQTSGATAQGVWAGFTDTLALSVLDTQPDNFGSYAGDGLDDSWQFDHFGLDNPAAAPAVDPDGDGQDNAFEFLADLDPTDPASHFQIWIAAIVGQPTSRNIVFQPLATGRTYTVQATLDLTKQPWLDLSTNLPSSDIGNQRAVTDTNATEPRKFYRVKITKP